MKNFRWNAVAHPGMTSIRRFSYPVLNRGYAEQIARQWNAKEAFSGYVGFVTVFAIDEAYAGRFPRQVVGASVHEELWVPAAELPAFNRQIVGRIRLVAACYGERYTGLSPVSPLLSGLPPAAQLRHWAELYRRSAEDFAAGLAADWLSVYLNARLWMSLELEAEADGCGLGAAERQELLAGMERVWRERLGDRPWPAGEDD